MLERAKYRTKEGREFFGHTAQEIADARKTLIEEYGLRYEQLCEAASYSMAMVVRFALGLSAHEGRVCALVGDCLASWVALATLRHLVNGGAEGILVFVDAPPTQPSEQLSLQLSPLRRMGVEEQVWKDNDSLMDAMFGSCHNVLFGLFDDGALSSEARSHIVEFLNERQVPIHTVEAPLGVDLSSGEKQNPALYASSTLSLGMMPSALHPVRDLAGRMYLCDSSIPRELYERCGDDLCPLFAEQPVIQVFPVTDEEPDVEVA